MYASACAAFWQNMSVSALNKQKEALKYKSRLMHMYVSEHMATYTHTLKDIFTHLYTFFIQSAVGKIHSTLVAWMVNI